MLIRPGRLTLEPRVSMLLGAVRSRTDTPDLRAALAEDLLERVWTALPPDADHLLVLPDGPLHAAPLGPGNGVQDLVYPAPPRSTPERTSVLSDGEAYSGSRFFSAPAEASRRATDERFWSRHAM